MKLTLETIKDNHYIACHSEQEQINTFKSLIKKGWKVDLGERNRNLSFKGGVLNGDHSKYPNIRWGRYGFMMSRYGSIPITLDDLVDLNEHKEKATAEQPIECRIEEERKRAKIELLKELIDDGRNKISCNLDTSEFQLGVKYGVQDFIIHLHSRLNALREEL